METRRLLCVCFQGRAPGCIRHLGPRALLSGLRVAPHTTPQHTAHHTDSVLQDIPGYCCWGLTGWLDPHLPRGNQGRLGRPLNFHKKTDPFHLRAVSECKKAQPFSLVRVILIMSLRGQAGLSDVMEKGSGCISGILTSWSSLPLSSNYFWIPLVRGFLSYELQEGCCVTFSYLSSCHRF